MPPDNDGAATDDLPGDIDVAAASPELPAPARVDSDAVAAAVSAVQAAGGVATPIAQDVEAVDVTFSVGGATIGDGALDALSGLERVLAWLDLGRTSVTDAGVAALAPYHELRRLHLERTQITDACLDDLAQFTHLRYLNLYGTAVTDAAVETLAALPNLEQVYLWDTKVTDDGVARLAELRPELSIVAALDLPPIVEEAAQIKGTPAPCCAEAAAAGKECEHECCVAARAAGKVCEKCGGKPAE